MGGIFLIALIVATWLLHKRYYRLLIAQGGLGKIKIALIILGIVFLVMALTGRASPIFALLGALMTQIIRLVPLLVRYAPFLAKYLGPTLRSGGFGKASDGSQFSGFDQTSRVNTRSVAMTLDKGTGVLDGVVLHGKFKDRRLSDLTIRELRDLYQSATAHDPEAARLLIAYASRERGDEWEADCGPSAGAASDNGNRGDSASAPTLNEAVNVSEALDILGLAPNPDRQAIIDAHRALISRMHPDRGGSNYLATKINLAKQVLLDTID